MVWACNIVQMKPLLHILKRGGSKPHETHMAMIRFIMELDRIIIRGLRSFLLPLRALITHLTQYTCAPLMQARTARRPRARGRTLLLL